MSEATPIDGQSVSRHLGAAFDGLVGATHLTKQVMWSGASAQRDLLKDLLAFLGEQTRLVDEAESRAGGRAAGLPSPSGRKRPNLLGKVDNDRPAALAAYQEHLRTLVADLRHHAADMGTTSQSALLLDVAAGLETRLFELEQPGKG